VLTPIAGNIENDAKENKRNCDEKDASDRIHDYNRRNVSILTMEAYKAARTRNYDEPASENQDKLARRTERLTSRIS
jgi:hypothetical protein